MAHSFHRSALSFSRYASYGSSLVSTVLHRRCKYKNSPHLSGSEENLGCTYLIFVFIGDGLFQNGRTQVHQIRAFAGVPIFRGYQGVVSICKFFKCPAWRITRATDSNCFQDTAGSKLWQNHIRFELPSNLRFVRFDTTNVMNICFSNCIHKADQRLLE